MSESEFYKELAALFLKRGREWHGQMSCDAEVSDRECPIIISFAVKDNDRWCFSVSGSNVKHFVSSKWLDYVDGLPMSWPSEEPEED